MTEPWLRSSHRYWPVRSAAFASARLKKEVDHHGFGRSMAEAIAKIGEDLGWSLPGEATVCQISEG